MIGSTQIKWEGRPASLAIISDITDLVESQGKLKKAEEDLRNQREVLARLDRTAALEHLSGSIAHELNQPLTGILGNAQACELLIKQRSCRILRIAGDRDRHRGGCEARRRSDTKPA